MRDQPLTALVSKAIDSVHTLTHGLHAAIQTMCPEARTDKALLDACITGPSLLPYLLNVSFSGRSGNIKFDAKGDGIGQYVFSQYTYHPTTGGAYVDVALWDQDQQEIFINNDVINWDIFNVRKNDEFLQGADALHQPPVSVCSLPCGLKEFSIRLDLPCCWECHQCRHNEFLGPNSSTCVQCPPNTWPDDQTATFCEPISPTYLRLSDPIGIGLLILNCLALLSGLLVLALFIKNGEEKLIKASSRELSSIILAGILLAYLSVLAFIAKPAEWSCMLRYIGFHLSVSLIYCPLLIKTNRVHRIFSAGKKGVKRITFVGSKWQILFTVILVLVQVSHETLKIMKK